MGFNVEKLSQTITVDWSDQIDPTPPLQHIHVHVHIHNIRLEKTHNDKKLVISSLNQMKLLMSSSQIFQVSTHREVQSSQPHVARVKEGGELRS